MLTAGIINIVLAVAGVFLMVSSGWQVTQEAKVNRIGAAVLCWIAAATLGAVLYVVSGP